MKKFLGILVLGFLFVGNAYATRWVYTTITELVDDGYKLTHTVYTNNLLYLIFENEDDIYSCEGTNNKGYVCSYLTDGGTR